MTRSDATSSALKSSIQVRNADGELVAIQYRIDHPDGTKDIWWQNPATGQFKLGFPRDELPLWQSELARDWDADALIVVTEGAKAACALRAVGVNALAIMGGAPSTPTDPVLAVLAGRNAVLWPDADRPGQVLMQRTYRRLWRCTSVGLIHWPDAPEKGDAADATSEEIQELIRDAVDLGVPPQPAETPDTLDAVRLNRGGPISEFNASFSITEVLELKLGLLVDAPDGEVVPIHCVGHIDRRKSAAVSKDNRRLWCHQTECVIHNDGRGRDAFDLWGLAKELQHGQ